MDHDRFRQPAQKERTTPNTLELTFLLAHCVYQDTIAQREEIKQSQVNASRDTIVVVVTSMVEVRWGSEEEAEVIVLLDITALQVLFTPTKTLVHLERTNLAVAQRTQRIVFLADQVSIARDTRLRMSQIGVIQVTTAQRDVPMPNVQTRPAVGCVHLVKVVPAPLVIIVHLS
eukprot:PhF_6_TR38645/c0_g1_i1/m.57705